MLFLVIRSQRFALYAFSRKNFTDCEIIINDVIPHELNFNVMKRGEIIWFVPVLLLWSFNLVVNRLKRQKFLLYKTYVPVDVRRWWMFKEKCFSRGFPVFRSNSDWSNSYDPQQTWKFNSLALQSGDNFRARLLKWRWAILARGLFLIFLPWTNYCRRIFPRNRTPQRGLINVIFLMISPAKQIIKTWKIYSLCHRLAWISTSRLVLRSAAGLKAHNYCLISTSI